MKLRLEIEVEYEPEDVTRQELDAMLLSIATQAAAEGRMTGDTDAAVDYWEARVVAL